MDTELMRFPRVQPLALESAYLNQAGPDQPLRRDRGVSTAETKPATGRRKTRPVAGCQAPWRVRSPHSWCGPWRFGPSGPLLLHWDQALSVDLLVRLWARR